jgi:hypothetical protein
MDGPGAWLEGDGGDEAWGSADDDDARSADDASQQWRRVEILLPNPNRQQ